MENENLSSELLKNFTHVFYVAGRTGLSDLMFGELKVLMLVAASENNELLPGKIGECLNLTNSRVTATLKSLEQKGLILRNISPSDRRRVLVTATPKGLRHVKARCDWANATVQKLIDAMGEEESAQLSTLLRKVVCTVYSLNKKIVPYSCGLSKKEEAES